MAVRLLPRVRGLRARCGAVVAARSTPSLRWVSVVPASTPTTRHIVPLPAHVPATPAPTGDKAPSPPPSEETRRLNGMHNRRTSQVSAFAARTTFEDLPTAVVQRTKDIIFDTIGVTVAGSRHPEMRAMANYYANAGAREDCTIIGRNIRTSADNAAFVNGSSGHVLDFDDTWAPATHTAASMLPALLALAERLGASGRDVITAYAVGMEVQARLLLAAQNRNIPVLYHPPGTVGTLGCAAATANLLGLGEAETASALGIAASRASGLMGNVGSTTKCSHSGHAARMGLESASLTQAGFTGADDILDHPEGYAAAFAADWDETVFDAIGAPYHIEEQNVALKRYPSHLATHWAITAALACREAVVEAIGASSRDEVARRVTGVHVQGPVRSYIYRPNPRTTHDTKFSLEYTTVAALLDGEVGIDTFSRKAMDDGTLRSVLGRVDVLQDPTIPCNFETMHVRVTVTLDDGRQFSERANTWRGHWSNPQSPAELEDKFRTCVRPSLASTEGGLGSMEEFISHARSLEAVEDLGQVLRLLTPASDDLVAEEA